MSTIEYRKLFRANVSLQLNYQTIKEPKIEGVTFSRNLSSTGLNVILLDKIKEGEELALEIFLPQEAKAVIAKGRIIWQRPCSYQPESKRRYYSTGIHILEMASGDAIKTSDFISETLRKQKENEDREIVERIEKLLADKK